MTSNPVKSDEIAIRVPTHRRRQRLRWCARFCSMPTLSMSNWRSAMHCIPPAATEADFLAGMKEGMLKRLLKKRFAELEKKREEQT